MITKNHAIFFKTNTFVKVTNFAYLKNGSDRYTLCL